MSGKIAPRLHEIVDEIRGDRNFLKRDHEVCRRELRALLAVARAARAVIDGTRSDFSEEERLDRALMRLERASRPARAKKERA